MPGTDGGQDRRRASLFGRVAGRAGLTWGAVRYGLELKRSRVDMRRTARTGRSCRRWRWASASWSLQVRSVAELKRLLDDLGVSVTQIACGDPHHASWDEGDAMPEAARASGLVLTGAMLGFPGEDYTTPADDQGHRRIRQPGRPPRAARPARLGAGPDRRAGPVRPDAPRRVPPRARRPRPLGDARHPGQGRPARGREGGHPRLRDRPGDRRPAPPDARRPEGAQPQGQLRPGQHAPLRHGRPDPRRRDPRPRHPERPRQGRQPPDHPRRSGARRSRSARARSTSPGSSGPSRRSATPARWSSSARSATRPGGSATSPTAWPSSASAWPRRARTRCRSPQLGSRRSRPASGARPGASPAARPAPDDGRRPGETASMIREPCGHGSSRPSRRWPLTAGLGRRPAQDGRKTTTEKIKREGRQRGRPVKQGGRAAPGTAIKDKFTQAKERRSRWGSRPGSTPGSTGTRRSTAP